MGEFFGHDLEPGVINMLLALAGMSGAIGRERDPRLYKFVKDAHRMRELSREFCLELEGYIKIMFSSLSVCTQVEVTCEKFEKFISEDNRIDVQGKITIKSTPDCSAEFGIVLDIFPCHVRISLLESSASSKNLEEEKKEMLSIKRRCEKLHSFAGCLLAGYIEGVLYRASTKEEKERACMEAVREAVLHAPESMNRLLVQRKIEDCVSKSALVDYLLIFAMENGFALSEKHPIVRTTSNIVGSMQLNRFNIQQMFVGTLILTGVCQPNGGGLYPRVWVTSGKGTLLLTEGYTSSSLASQRVVQANCPSVLVVGTDVFLKATKKLGPLCKQLNIYDEDTPHIFGCIFKTQTIEQAESIFNLLDTCGEEAYHLRNILYVNWFLVACERAEEYAQVVRPLYDRIDENALRQVMECPWIFIYRDSLPLVISVLEGMQDELCLGQDSTSKFKSLLQIIRHAQIQSGAQGRGHGHCSSESA